MLVHSGAGTILHRYLSAIGIKPDNKCNCLAMIRKMDDNGADWCEDHTDEILDVMRDNAKTMGVVFIRSAAAILLSRAIRQSRLVNGDGKRQEALNQAGAKVGL